MPLTIPSNLTLLPHHLSASDRNPSSNFTLHNLRHPSLNLLEQCTTMHRLHQLHAHLITTNLIASPFAASRLIAFSALSLNGDLAYACTLFNQLHTPNLFTYNAMIRALSKSNHPYMSLQLYIDLLSSELVPDSYTFPFLLKACSNMQGFQEGVQVHAHVVKFGLECSSYESNSLVHLYSELGCFESARKVFDKMGERSEIAVAAMIGGYVNNNQPNDAIGFFCSMDWKRLRFDEVTLGSVVTACARVRNLELGKEVHCYVEENGVEMSLILCNSLVSMYAKCGQLEDAEALFRCMHEKDSVSWNVLISGFADNGYLEEGLELFAEMKKTSMKANEATFLSLISACTKLELGEKVHGFIREMGFESHVPICNALIDMYSKIGHAEIGREVFDEMPERDIITWNSMIAGYTRRGSMEVAHLLFRQMTEKDNVSWSTMILGYVRNDQPKEALKVYKELLAEGSTKPDKVTVISVLTACSQLGALEEGISLHLYIENNAIEIDVTLGTALIDMYSKCGCSQKAIEIFRDMKHRDVFSWTALISGLALNGFGQKALQVFEEMQKVGNESQKPNSVTFLSVLSACAHSGLVEEGSKIYDVMLKDYKIEPEMAHLGSMVDLLGRAGHLDEALEFVLSSGCEVDASVWGALLGACRIHGNVALAEIAAKKIVELDPTHEAAHVLMSNIYAEARQWTNKKELRMKMKDANISKEVGMSWIEVNGVLHEFAAGGIRET